VRWIVATVLFVALITATYGVEFLEAQSASEPQVLLTRSTTRSTVEPPVPPVVCCDARSMTKVPGDLGDTAAR
jgi:hypothetical protein